MKINMRVKAFTKLMGIILISGCSDELTPELQESGLSTDATAQKEIILEKIEKYKGLFIGLYTTDASEGEVAVIKIEEREISTDSSEGAVLFVYTDADCKELRYRLHIYGETGNAVLNYYLCEGFVWMSKQTDHYSSYIMTSGFSDVLCINVENRILSLNSGVEIPTCFMMCRRCLFDRICGTSDVSS